MTLGVIFRRAVVRIFRQRYPATGFEAIQLAVRYLDRGGYLRT